MISKLCPTIRRARLFRSRAAGQVVLESNSRSLAAEQMAEVLAAVKFKSRNPTGCFVAVAILSQSPTPCKRCDLVRSAIKTSGRSILPSIRVCTRYSLHGRICNTFLSGSCEVNVAPIPPPHVQTTLPFQGAVENHVIGLLACSLLRLLDAVFNHRSFHVHSKLILAPRPFTADDARVQKSDASNEVDICSSGVVFGQPLFRMSKYGQKSLQIMLQDFSNPPLCPSNSESGPGWGSRDRATSIIFVNGKQQPNTHHPIFELDSFRNVMCHCRISGRRQRQPRCQTLFKWRLHALHESRQAAPKGVFLCCVHSLGSSTSDVFRPGNSSPLSLLSI